MPQYEVVASDALGPLVAYASFVSAWLTSCEERELFSIDVWMLYPVASMFCLVGKRASRHKPELDRLGAH